MANRHKCCKSTLRASIEFTFTLIDVIVILTLALRILHH
jgi:hypothetical protein